MAPGRDSKSKRKKEAVRFVVISPKVSTPLKFSDRLFDPANLSFSRRIGAALIAAACIFAGLALTALGLRDGSWFIGLLGPAAIFYGTAWGQVAFGGRLRGGRLRLNPWRRKDG
jgi:hypothetical protein